MAWVCMLVVVFVFVGGEGDMPGRESKSKVRKVKGFSDEGEIGLLETAKWSSKSLGKGRRVVWEGSCCGGEVVFRLCW